MDKHKTYQVWNPGEGEANADIFKNGQVILIDKALHWTSFNVVKKLRGLLCYHYKIGKLKVGHAGTLDPLASGLVVICTGKATKSIELLQSGKKEYFARFHIGATTPSFDLETEIDNTYPVEHIKEDDVKSACEKFLGDIDQMPPAFSAKKIQGVRAYEMARKGEEPNLKPVRVTNYEIEILSFDLPILELRIVCSKGTYIRALARDIGVELKSGAYMEALRRTKVGNFNVKEACSVDEFEKRIKNL